MDDDYCPFCFGRNIEVVIEHISLEPDEPGRFLAYHCLSCDIRQAVKFEGGQTPIPWGRKATWEWN